MKQIVALTAVLLFTSWTLMAQGKGHAGNGMGSQVGGPRTSSGDVHSNAPAGAPAASADRDKGTKRASDVGSGKKKGLSQKKSAKTLITTGSHQVLMNSVNRTLCILPLRRST